MTITTLSKNKSFGGQQGVYSHESLETGTTMRFGVYLPPAAEVKPVPVLFWLSGLTCTEENFIVKAGAQRMAAELGLAIVTPDTSPRGLNYPGDTDSYDFGVGAGFYVDATTAPWAKGYRMSSYITKELFDLVFSEFSVESGRAGIFGHSMGGHGALTIGLKNPEKFRTISAFSPIVSPSRCPWGEKALSGYLGADRSTWDEYDATCLVRKYGWSGPEILVDQGSADQFLQEQLKPELLVDACTEAGVSLNLRMQPGYDHSYFFISTFIEDHLRHHASHL
ncbi:S-formylglutathione hydrolase [Candidimonas sp. SYP-B2681]|uniref:S-formylglutathione hydrolase n=1 Tax=Candidimonas sp. SYP-B2681 TaxID=2497686 RepID=UPI000F85C610|nr:S-formylglutathione hydrolase [Candidimonas sp. SYP-B2681]RTZ42425.1 S-formylglutathione hydrolase [Candidimonas sp. SYP-B2681]